ncbi:hypothetical protein BDW62DRAFT_159264 [Aspergillus aurantiobrunneus]
MLSLRNSCSSGWDGQDAMDLQTLLDAGPAISHSPDFTGFNTAYQDGWTPSAAHITAGCELFFAHVAHFVPFLHQPTFNASQTPLRLLVSMLSLAFQYGDDLDSEHSGPDLSSRCFHRVRLLLANNPPDTITTVQPYLLLQICAMMCVCGAHSAHALTMHSSMISLARSTGLMPLEPSTRSTPSGTSSFPSRAPSPTSKSSTASPAPCTTGPPVQPPNGPIASSSRTTVLHLLQHSSTPTPSGASSRRTHLTSPPNPNPSSTPTAPSTSHSSSSPAPAKSPAGPP